MKVTFSFWQKVGVGAWFFLYWRGYLFTLFLPNTPWDLSVCPHYNEHIGYLPLFLSSASTSYIPTLIRIHTFIHPYNHAFIYPHNYTFIHPHIHTFIYPYILQTCFYQTQICNSSMYHIFAAASIHIFPRSEIFTRSTKNLLEIHSESWNGNISNFMVCYHILGVLL